MTYAVPPPTAPTSSQDGSSQAWRRLEQGHRLQTMPQQVFSNVCIPNMERIYVYQSEKVNFLALSPGTVPLFLTFVDEERENEVGGGHLSLLERRSQVRRSPVAARPGDQVL